MQAKRTEQDIAKDLYLQTDLSHQQIADILDVSRRSVWLWVRNNRWQEMKEAARQMPGIILQDIYGHIIAINDKIRERDPGDRCPTKDEVENLRKLIRMSKDLSKRDVGTYMQSYGELMIYIAKVDHDLAAKLTKHVNNYVTANFVDDQARASKESSANVRTAVENLKKMSKSALTVAPDHIKDKEEDQHDTTVHSTSLKATIEEESPFRGLGRDNDVITCDNDVIMCDDPVITPSAPSKTPRPATDDDMDQEIADMLGLTVEQVRQIANDEITEPELKKLADTDIDKILQQRPPYRK